MLLSHADRTRIGSGEHRRLLYSQNGIVHPTLLLDGFVRATCSLVRERKRVTLLVHPLERITQAERLLVAGEGMRLLKFIGSGAGDVQFEAYRADAPTNQGLRP